MAITRDIGAIRDILRALLGQGLGGRKLIKAVKRSNIRLNKAATIIARDPKVPEAQKSRFLRAAISKQVTAQGLSPLKRSEAFAVANRIGSPSTQASLRSKIESALPTARQAKRVRPTTSAPSRRQVASGLGGIGAGSEAGRALFAGTPQASTAEAAVNAIQKKRGLIPLLLAGGGGFIARGLFGGGGKRDSQLQTQSLVAQLLANQAGTNRQGLVNAQEEKTRLQAALLALKIIEQQNQTAPATIPFS